MNKVLKMVMYIEIFIHGVGSLCDASEYVSGYVNNKGTYVQGYVRSESNDSVYDNSVKKDDSTSRKSAFNSDSGDTIKSIFNQKAPSNNYGF